MFLISVAWAAEPCDPDAHRRLADTALAEARLDDASTSFAAAITALGCAELSASGLARLQVVHGSLLLLHAQDPAGASFAFRAARTLDDSVAPTVAGEVRDAWDAASPTRGPEVPVTLVGLPEGWTVLVDTRVITGPLSVPAGLHVLQVKDPGGSVRWGEMALAERPLTLQLPALSGPPLPQPAPDPTAPAPRAPTPGHTAARVVGTVLVGAGGVATGLSYGSRAAQADAPDLTALRVARDRQVGLGSAGLALLAAGATVWTVSFTW